MAKKKKHHSAPKLGAIYVNARAGAQVVGPLAYREWRFPAGGVGQQSLATIRAGAYPRGVAVSLIDRWGERKIGHAAALSRGSVTALAPEALAWGQAANDQNLDPEGTVVSAGAYMNGYETRSGIFNINLAKPYLTSKYGLAFFRRVANRTRLAEPIKAGLAMVGGTL